MSWVRKGEGERGWKGEGGEREERMVGRERVGEREGRRERGGRREREGWSERGRREETINKWTLCGVPRLAFMLFLIADSSLYTKTCSRRSSSSLVEPELFGSSSLELQAGTWVLLPVSPCSSSPCIPAA